MEKIKHLFQKFEYPSLSFVKKKLLGLFFADQTATTKKDIQWKNVVIFLSGIGFFMTFYALFKPEQEQRKFLETLPATQTLNRVKEKKDLEKNSVVRLWQAPSSIRVSQNQGPQLNTKMVVTMNGNNSHLQFGQGTKIKVQITEKLTASQDSIPVIAVTTEEVQTEAGQIIPQGSQLYGEATYTPGTDRVHISFKQLALPSGQIKSLSATLVGIDGEPGILGDVHSDGLKNTAGQMISTFVGGLAEGSVSRDFMGQSRGGVTNGLLSAVADTARNSTEKYADKLKQQREWIEIPAGAEGYAVLSQSLKMLDGETSNE